MQIIEKPIAEIQPYEDNPRHNDGAVDAVAASIKEFGFKVPVILDDNGVVVAGHTRIKAAQQLGLVAVPCIVASDLSPEQIKAFRLADNKVAEIATWDNSKLADELTALAETDIDMELFGFDLAKLKITPAAEEDDFEVVAPEEPQAKRGDIYQLGRHRLMCGDSTKAEDVQALVGGAEIDLLQTDPPYNVDYVGKTADALTIDNDKMSDADFVDFLQAAFENADAVMKPGAVFYIWLADTKRPEFQKAMEAAGWQVRQCLIWSKNVFVMGRQDYHWQHEPCLYGWKEGAAHYWASDRSQSTLLEFDRPARSEEHPTMKPIPLIDYQIQNNTKAGDKVLDLFGGSGTTLIACEQNDRDCFLMEYDPRYVDVVIARWEALTGEKAQRIANTALKK